MNLINLALYVVATQTGGGVLATPSNLGALIGKRVEEASKFYSLTFDPPPTNKVDEYHDLKVEVSEPNSTVRTSTSYYNQPVFYDQPPAGSRTRDGGAVGACAENGYRVIRTPRWPGNYRAWN